MLFAKGYYATEYIIGPAYVVMPMLELGNA
jgi:hypothetical protein